MAEINKGFDSPPEDVANGQGAVLKAGAPSKRAYRKVQGSTVSYHDLKYSVEIPGKCCHTREKQILFGVR